MAERIIHLDTSFLIRALHPNSSEDRQLRRWLTDGVRLGISAIGWTEFMCGPLDRRQHALAAVIVGEPEPFVGQDSIQTAELFNRSGRRRGSLLDCMIAAIAIRVDASLANHESRRLPSLRRPAPRITRPRGLKVDFRKLIDKAASIRLTQDHTKWTT